MDVLLLILRLVLAGLLYAFLVAILIMLWRDLHLATARREAVHIVGHLIVLSAPSDSLAEGTILPLQPVTSIGRAATNTLCIPDTYASAQHALLTWRAGQWWLEDQGSRNGTLLNDNPVTVPTVVSAGDILGIGNTQLKLELAP